MVGSARRLHGARAGTASAAEAADARRRGAGCCGGGCGALASRASGGQRGAPLDRDLARGARALPAACTGTASRQRRWRRRVGRQRRRVQAPARGLRRGSVVAARAVRDRGNVERGRSDRPEQRRSALVDRAAERRVPAVGRFAHEHACRVSQRATAPCRCGRRHGRRGSGGELTHCSRLETG